MAVVYAVCTNLVIVSGGAFEPGNAHLNHFVIYVGETVTATFDFTCVSHVRIFANEYVAVSKSTYGEHYAD